MKKLLNFPHSADPVELNGAGLLLAMSKAHGEQVRQSAESAYQDQIKARLDRTRKMERETLDDLYEGLKDRMKDNDCSFELVDRVHDRMTVVVDGHTFDVYVNLVEHD